MVRTETKLLVITVYVFAGKNKFLDILFLNNFWENISMKNRHIITADKK